MKRLVYEVRLYPPKKTLPREPKRRKPLNPNCFILYIIHLLFFHLNLQTPVPVRDGFIGREFTNGNFTVAIGFDGG